MAARHISWYILCSICPLVAGKGIMLLYQPLDISNDCVFSTTLRYDLSFGMGLSDTISLLFRTIDEIDYQCRVDIVTDQSKGVYLLLVIKYPNPLGVSCEINPNAFAIFKKDNCIRICDQVEYKKYPSKLLKLYMTGRVRFRFVSNSSVNADINAHSYLVTATSARLEGNQSCRANETRCSIEGRKFCFTGGVACDGIENCGLAAWYDERVSECVRRRQNLSVAPIIAVIALIFCSLLTVTHIVMKCIPSVAGAFFIFNANEDNRFCLNPVFSSPEGVVVENAKPRLSILPKRPSTTSSSADSDSEDYGGPEPRIHTLEKRPSFEQLRHVDYMDRAKTFRKSVVRDMTSKIGDTIRSVAGRMVHHHHGENKQFSNSNQKI